jgi:hypothetical protein
MAVLDHAAPHPAAPAWLVVTGQELRDLWWPAERSR